jgi:diadenylate cyclase
MTENSDAVVLVVSEETGTISIVVNGQITRDYNPVSAGAELKRLLLEAEQKEKKSFVASILERIKPRKKEGKE